MEQEYVIKRNGVQEEVSFDKIKIRIQALCNNLNINPTKITRKIAQEMFNGIHTRELDELGAQICASLGTEHPDYNTLASRIIISNHHKNTSPSFSETMTTLYNNTDLNNNHSPLISEDLYKVVQQNMSKLNDTIKYERDYLIDYFGFKTLEKSYLIRIKADNSRNIKGEVVERPQHLLMRVSLGIHGSNIKDAINTYHLMSNKYFIHATPTLFNAGTNRPQLSSCFLLSMKDDSIQGIYDTLKDCALISKWAGGIGVHMHNIRAKNSKINGTNGISNGLVPMLRVFNNTARYVDQCFTYNTIVYTINGPLKIEDVVTNDKVITSDGSLRNVNKVIPHYYSGDIYNIELASSHFRNVEVTPEHPILSYINTYSNDYEVVKNRLKSKLGKLTYNEIKKLSKNDLVAMPIIDYINDIDSFSNTDCYFYGLVLAHGYITHNGTFTMTFDKKCNTSIEVCKTYLDNLLIPFNIRNEPDDASIIITWQLDKNFKFTRNMFVNKKNYEKRIHKNFLFLEKSKTMNILRAYIDDNYLKIDETTIIISGLELLINQIRFLLLRLNIIPKECRWDHSNNRYDLHLQKNKFTEELLEHIELKPSKANYCKYDNYLLCPIKSITKSHYTGTLYDFEIDTNHNYLTEIGIAHNGGGKRNGSIAVYLEPWHADIFDFLLLKKNHGNEEDRARDLFYALWISDLFMKRVKENGKWTLFCPNECPGLSDCHSDEFDELYTRYEDEGRGRKTIDAQKLWYAILESQIETGTPYILYKDACNRKSNQQNLGTIKSSNLCTEIIEYSSPTEYAVCNLASIGLSNYVNNGLFDFDKLMEVTKVITRNLNKIIDINFYPVPEAKRSNMLHRPIGIGVQGLADVFAKLSLPFDSLEARKLNKEIFETIYYAALTESCKLAEEREQIVYEYIEYLENEELYDSITNNDVEYERMLDDMQNEYHIMSEEIDRDEYLGTYSSYIDSPMYNGKLQFDMWDDTIELKYDWTELRERIKKYGIRNSLLLAPMPTASTSQILGNNECFEPFTTNIYLRRTLAGEFVVLNKYLVNDLIQLELWTNEIKNEIVKNNGSIQNIDVIPDNLKQIYKTVWELSNKVLIDMSADRGHFICQSQSLNLFVEKPNFNNLSSMHFYSWSKGLKTGIYYLRTKPIAQAQQFTIEPDKQIKSVLACSRDNPDCEACSA